ncbi:MAG: hypothetical protein IJY30_05300, partial [Muribaculaceae bacterium]|nr:hypothetical protein [Muribaculaceae bacterium]
MKKQVRNLMLAGAAMLLASNVSAQVEAVTPAAGTANPYAYALTGAVADQVLTVNYALNADATEVAVLIKKGGEIVKTETLGAEFLAKGAHTATISLDGMEAADYTWAVSVTGAAKAAAEYFCDPMFYHPRGVDVDNNMESPAFGNVYVAEGMHSSDEKYHSATGGLGLYAFTADMTPIKNEKTGLLSFTGGWTLDYKAGTASAADLARVRVADDGRIFVTRMNDDG